MSSIDYINGLAARGIQLWAQDGKLQYKAPKEAITPQLLAELKQHKATLVALLEQFADSTGSYPLSYSQKSLWSLHRLNPASAAYNVTYAARLADALDLPALARCVDYLIARHPILRTRYRVVDGEPQQQVSTEASARLVVDKTFGADERAIREWIADEANKPFDLALSPIRLRLLVNTPAAGDAGSPRHVLLLNVHHIAADFWSLEIMVRELRELYALAVAQQPLKLAPLGLQYKDCVQHERERLQGAQGRALAAFWAHELRGEWPTLQLAADRGRPPVKTENGQVMHVGFGAATTRSVKEAAKALHVTPYMLLLGVYQLFLFQHTGQSRLLIGAPTSGRNMAGSENVLGHFVNTVVLPCELHPDEPFAALLARTRSMMLRVLDHQDYPFPLLVETLRPPRDPSRSPLFQVMYNWNQVRADTAAAQSTQPALFGPALAASSTGTRGATHDLTLNVQDEGGEYTAAWTFNTDLFDEATIARFAAQYLGLVEQVLVDSQQALSRYRMASYAVRARTLERIARAARSAEAGSPLPAAFGARARAQPHEPAWQLGERVLSRAAVAETVQSLRAALQAQGVREGSVVGVRLASVAELAVTVLALLDLKAQAYPIEAEGAAASGAPIASPHPDAIVCGGSAGWDAWDPAAIAVVKDSEPARGRAREAAATAAQIGRFIEGIGEVLDVDDASRPLLLAGTDLRLALAVMVIGAARGACVCVPGDVSIAALARGDESTSDRLAQALVRHRATTLALPALLSWRAASASFASLRTLMAYGEHAHPVEQLARSAMAPGALRFLPVFCLASWVGPLAFGPSEGGWRLQPLAGPYPVALALGPMRDLADERQCGRLHLLTDRSPGLENGHELVTRFHEHGDLANALMHHRLVDTPLVVTARGDELRCASPTWRVAGHRAAPFDLGPVESLLAAQPQVHEVVCLLQFQEEAACLTACVVLDAAAETDDDTEAALRRALKRALPDAMHPDVFAVLERLPLADDGGLDASRLPPPRPRALASRAAAGDIERRLAAIWCEVLSRPAVGADDDFFQLGGDSILAAVIVSKAGAEGLYLQPKDVFEHPTIAALARVVSETPQIEAEQGEVSGEALPGPAAAWFFDKIDIDRSHFNQALMLALREAPDDALMRESLRLLAQHHDVLRSRFSRSDGGWRQRFGAAEAAASVDWDMVSCVDADGQTSVDRWHQAIESAQRGLDIEQGPLCRVRWLAGATLADSRLLVVVHHLLIDGVSWSLLLQDLADIYLRLRSGAAARLPLKTSSAKAWVEQWSARLGSEAMAGERAHWQAFAARLRATLADGSSLALMRHGATAALPAGGGDGPGSCAITLDADLTEAFRTRAHQAYGTDANDLLLAALYAGFHAWSGSQALLLDLEGHGREALADTVDLGRSIGWFTSIYPVLLQAGAVDDPAQLIKQVKQGLREVPAKGAGFGALRYLADADDPTRQVLAALPPSPVLFTYLGQLDQMVGASGLYAGTVEPAPGIRSPRQRRTHLLDVCAYVSQGRLTIECGFDGAAAVEDSIGCLMQRIEEALIALLRHCCSDGAGGLTPSDVPDIDIDQDGLDALLDEVAALG
ncbi:MAG TPA: condensation domain-containing protein [Albitalea sp.]|nr:condensation domain-containing protein [Albitalea sp.]